jgi:tRNA nucleotidyltransferase (CCA-adding enzyme)
MKRATAALFQRAIPESTRGLVEAVLKAADERGAAVYVVGGPVRDLLLDRPVVDVDLLVEGSAAQDLAAAAAPPGAKLVSHGRFGTVTLQADGANLDIATVRRESYAHDGALPSVEPATLEEDLHRRDFSANALALPLSGEARSRHTGLVDPEGGAADVEARRLRVLHPRSFSDDPTRALRAARLAPRLGFSLSRGTRSALRSALRDGAFGKVSGDRLRRELIRVFDDAREGLDPARALRLASEWHVLGALEPGLGLPKDAVVGLRRVGRAVASPPWRVGRCRPWVSGFCVWLAPLAPGLRRRALKRLSVRGDVAERIALFPRSRDAWLRALERARGRGAIDAALAAVDEDSLLALHASATPTLRLRIARHANEDRQRRMPISGDDLLAIGLEGPALGRTLSRVRVAFLDGAVSTPEEALALAVEIAKRSGRRKPRRR